MTGQPADLVFLSTGTDVNLLVDHGLVDKNYDKQSYKGVAANSVVVFAVRDGNPKKIKGWNDLLKPGVEVVTPNPFTAGIAKWNILAAYGAQRHLGKTDKQAIAFVKALFGHVVSQDSSGSNATNTFLSGKGDVLITFESEAINARLAGRDIQYVIPRQTMLIELLVAVMKKSPNKDAATSFIRYMKSHAGAGPVRSERVPADRARSGQAVPEAVPGAARHVHDQRQGDRRLARGGQEVVQPELEHHGHDREEPRSVDLWQLRPLPRRLSFRGAV